MKKSVTLFFAFVVLYGCSSDYSESNLRKLTSRATGLGDYDFIIGNRENNTFSIKYDIKTNVSNNIYHCDVSFYPLIPRSGGVSALPICKNNEGIILQPEVKAPIRF